MTCFATRFAHLIFSSLQHTLLAFTRLFFSAVPQPAPIWVPAKEPVQR